MPPTDPQTTEEWQTAVDGAHFFLLLDSAKQYGLVTGGPKKINVDRCEELLSRGKQRGILPSPDVIEKFLPAFIGGRKR